MSWVLAFAGFAALIVLHEFGHFAAAKAVGMRVERFALFFPPIIAKVRRGETEYGIGAIPLGGYVRITGMNPSEEIDPKVAHRAYYRQPVWKRIVVIAAGPAMNVIVAFAIIFLLLLVNGQPVATNDVGQVEQSAPAAGKLAPGDTIVSVDGVRGDRERIRKQINTHRCADDGRRGGCRATTPAIVVVERDGRKRAVQIVPVYDATPEIETMRLGFGYRTTTEPVGPIQAAGDAVDVMWRVTTLTVEALARVVTPEGREQISGVVGGYKATQESFDFDTTRALQILALISLSLAIVNMFPFLPLDGGHIFWAVVEKIRGKPVPFSVMERSGVIGFVLVIALFFIGLSNDIGRLQGEGFTPQR